MQLKEVKNGRLAMWAAAGMILQGVTTDQSALGNLLVRTPICRFSCWSDVCSTSLSLRMFLTSGARRDQFSLSFYTQRVRSLVCGGLRRGATFRFYPVSFSV